MNRDVNDKDDPMMTNGGNERLKRRYTEYLRESRQLNDRSIDAESKALERFEIYSGWRDFGRFKTDLAVAFKRHLARQTNGQTGEALSKATIYATLTALHKFFTWLAHQPGYRKRISETDADYFKASLKDRTTAKSVGLVRVPTLAQVRTALAAMPDHAPVEKRDRAIIAVAILTGARDDAIASLRIEHLDLDEERLFQDGRKVRTKFGKSIEAFFFPVGDDFVDVLRVWVDHLRNVEGFGPTDPLFPPVKTGLGSDGAFTPVGFSRTCWANADPIRAIFERAFFAVNMPYYNPHSFRKTLTQYGLELGLGEAGLKAWSQNLGHEDVLITLRSYGELPSHRQRDLIRGAAHIHDDDKLAMNLGRAALAAARKKTAG